MLLAFSDDCLQNILDRWFHHFIIIDSKHSHLDVRVVWMMSLTGDSENMLYEGLPPVQSCTNNMHVSRHY
jgi:hypothetical protein